MNKILSMSILIASILSGCSDSPKNLDEFMVDISEFKIDKNILKDGDRVEILGSSGNLTEAHEIDFYTLAVVRSLETGDTVNVLLTNYFMADLNDTETKFMSNASLLGKLTENASDIEALKNVDVNELQPKSFKKVFYDSEYIQVDVRKYPAITGNLGDYTIEGDLEVLNKE